MEKKIQISVLEAKELVEALDALPRHVRTPDVCVPLSRLADALRETLENIVETAESSGGESIVLYDSNPRVEVPTPMGLLTAYASKDPDYPGIFIDLERPGEDWSIALANVECPNTNSDEPPKIMTGVWADAMTENLTHRIEHVNVDEAFAEVAREDQENQDRKEGEPT